MIVIGLLGAAGAGKDTIGDILFDEFGFIRTHFGDPLYTEIEAAFRVPELILRARKTKEEDTELLAVERSKDVVFVQRMIDAGHDINIPRSPRWILQRWGTEYRRADNPDYWVEKTEARIKTLGEQGVRGVTNTSVRFANELDLIRRLGGHSWLVLRAGARSADDGYASEQLWRHAKADLVIDNNGSIENLRRRVMDIVYTTGMLL